MGTDQDRDRLDQSVLREIVAGTALATGEAFFDELVRHLARALGTFGAWITEWLPEARRLRAFSFWAGDGFYGNYEYDVRHTPCEAVVEDRRLVHVPDRRLQSLWIPDGLDAKRSTGDPFPAEATLARFTLGEHTFHTVILRDVDDRLEAEAQPPGVGRGQEVGPFRGQKRTTCVGAR